MAGLTAGCGSLVHPSASGEERERHARLIGVLLAAPLVVSAAVVQLVAPVHGIAVALAVLCATFALSWLAALDIAARGRARCAGAAALAAGGLLASGLIALSGGAGAPVAALLAALPIEAWWVARSRKAVGVASAVALASAAAGSAWAAGAEAGIAPGWLWLSPLLYGALLGVRLSDDGEAQGGKHEAEVASLREDCLDAAVAHLVQGGEVEAISSRAGDVFGVEPALLLGSGLFDRIHVGDRVGFLCAAARTRDTGAPSRCEARVRLPVTATGEGGGYRTFEVEFVKPDDRVAAIIRDGEDKAALRAELADAQERAGAIEVSKGRFLAAVSHELRTPLNAIIGFSDMLLHREIAGALAPKQEEYVSLIHDAGNHLLSVVNAILDVSKIEAGTYRITVEPFGLKPAVDLCCAMLGPQAEEKGVSLTASLPAGLAEIAGDQRAVQQILINLVSNAVKFTPPGGSVGISASQRDGMVRILVNDTGIGISAEDMARLGRPFMQVQNDYTRQFQGTGLGLSLVKGLVRLHGGTMTMESAPALGTTVTIGLPAHESGAPDTQEEDDRKDDGIALRKIA